VLFARDRTVREVVDTSVSSTTSEKKFDEVDTCTL
jgi:hypothetical protein